LIGFSSCTKGTDINEVWPDVRVNFEISLDNYSSLKIPNNFIYLNRNDIPTHSAGINNHGIYILNTGDEFIAMDATCHNDINAEEHILIDEEYNSLGVCPLCDSKFIFLNGGQKHSGPAKYGLRNYKTYYNPNSRTLRVRN
jgi:nitrite reductase/ring-hydroxylating ferredoxin subunit